MSYAEHFVIINNLQPADAILLKKKFIGMFDHFAVYIGRDTFTNKPMFAANYTGGVKVLEEYEVNYFLQTLEPEKIDRFYGTATQRQSAIDRAFSQIGKTSYNLIFSNCEHYKNFVQFGQKYSAQVENAGKVAMIGGGIAAIAGAATGNNKAIGFGLFALALGAIALGASHQKDE